MPWGSDKEKSQFISGISGLTDTTGEEIGNESQTGAELAFKQDLAQTQWSDVLEPTMAQGAPPRIPALIWIHSNGELKEFCLVLFILAVEIKFENVGSAEDMTGTFPLSQAWMEAL